MQGLTPETLAEGKRLYDAMHAVVNEPTNIYSTTEKAYLDWLMAHGFQLRQEVEKSRTRCCAICNDTRHLDDAQAWDCGGENSDCPYCPDVVNEAREETRRLRAQLTAREQENAELRRDRDTWKSMHEGLEQSYAATCESLSRNGGDVLRLSLRLSTMHSAEKVSDAVTAFRDWIVGECNRLAKSDGASLITDQACKTLIEFDNWYSRFLVHSEQANDSSVATSQIPAPPQTTETRG